MQGPGEQHFLLICPTEKILSKYLRAHGNVKSTDSVPLIGPHAALSASHTRPHSTPPHDSSDAATPASLSRAQVRSHDRVRLRGNLESSSARARG